MIQHRDVQLNPAMLSSATLGWRWRRLGVRIAGLKHVIVMNIVVDLNELQNQLM